MSTPANPAPASKPKKQSLGQRISNFASIRNPLTKNAASRMNDEEYEKVTNDTMKNLINTLDDTFEICLDSYQKYKANKNDTNFLTYSNKYDDMINAQNNANDTFANSVEPVLKQNGEFEQIYMIREYLSTFTEIFFVEGLHPPADVRKLFQPQPAITTTPLSASALSAGLSSVGITATGGASATAAGPPGPPGGGGAAQQQQQQQSSSGTLNPNPTGNQYTLYTSPNINLIDKEVGKYNGEKAVFKPQQYLLRFESALQRQVQTGSITSATTIALFKMLLVEGARSWHELLEARALYGDPTAKAALDDWTVYKAQFLRKFVLPVTTYEQERLKTKLASEVRGLAGDQEAIFGACERTSFAIHSDKPVDTTSETARRSTTVELFLKYCDSAIKTQLARITLGSGIITYDNITQAINIVRAFRDMSKMSVSRGGVSAVTTDENADAHAGDDATEVAAVQSQAKKKKKKKNAENTTTSKDDAVQKGLCFFCRESGHLKAYCPTFKAEKPEEFKKFRARHDQLWAKRKRDRAQAQAGAVAEESASGATTNGSTTWSAERGQAAAVAVPPNQYSDVHALLALHQQE